MLVCVKTMPDISDYIKVPEGYSVVVSDGIYSVLKPETRQRLSIFLKQHLEMQHSEAYPFLSPEEIRKFPFIDKPLYRDEIFTRKQDLRMIDHLLQEYYSKGKRALEVGGWNNWLTRHLYSKGLHVVTADIFDDENNGLGSRRHFQSPGWTSVQMDVQQPEIFNTTFDVIILNHFLQFVSSPHEIVFAYKQLLRPGGIMLLTGLDFYHDTEPRIKKTRDLREACFKKHGFDLQFYPCKGFFDKEDFKKFRQNDFTFHTYQFSLLSRTKRLINGTKSGLLSYTKTFV